MKEYEVCIHTKDSDLAITCKADSKNEIVETVKQRLASEDTIIQIGPALVRTQDISWIWVIEKVVID